MSFIACDWAGEELAGFENHGGRTLLDPGTTPLGRVVHGYGNDGGSGAEGARAGRCFGTYLHGPLLPRNPWFADLLLTEALAHRSGAAVESWRCSTTASSARRSVSPRDGRPSAEDVRRPGGDCVGPCALVCVLDDLLTAEHSLRVLACDMAFDFLDEMVVGVGCNVVPAGAMENLHLSLLAR